LWEACLKIEIISLNRIDRFVFSVETDCVFCEVRSEFLYIILTKVVLQRPNSVR
jgi:hypothetical protein